MLNFQLLLLLVPFPSGVENDAVSLGRYLCVVKLTSYVLRERNGQEASVHGQLAHKLDQLVGGWKRLFFWFINLLLIANPHPAPGLGEPHVR